MNGSSVPAVASPAAASTAPAPPGAAGMPSAVTATGSMASAAPANCTAVTATGSRPVRMRPCATVNPADITRDASTRASPVAVALPPPPPATRPTPASDTAKPAQATGRATACCQAAAMIATSTGAEPISSAAWLTLVRVMPAFCTTTDPPYPTAPEASTRSVQAARSLERAHASSTAAARLNRANVSQAGGSQSRASLDSGTVVPQSSPAAVSAAMAWRR